MAKIVVNAAATKAAPTLGTAVSKDTTCNLVLACEAFWAKAFTKQQPILIDRPSLPGDGLSFMVELSMSNTEEPDYQRLAELWLARDPRTEQMDSHSRAQAVARLATALKARRQSVKHSDQDVGLVVNVDRDSFVPGQGLSSDTLDQLTHFIQERIDDENGV